MPSLLLNPNFGKIQKKQFKTIIFLMFFLFGSSVLVFSQQCQWTSNYFIDVIPVASNTASPQSGCSPLACDEVMYEVYLNAQSGAVPQTFEYNYFEVQGTVTVNTSSGEYIDVERSINCSPSWGADNLSFQENGIVAFVLGDPSGTAPPLSLGQTIQLNNGKALLFRVIVHAGPSAEISWSTNVPGANNPYIWVFGLNNSTLTPCPSGQFLVTFGGNTSPNVTLPAIASCQDLSYSFGDTPQELTILPDFNNGYFIIPVQLEGLTSPTILQEVEMVIEMRANTFMTYGNVEGGLFNCSNIGNANCDIEVSETTSGGNFYRTIHAHSYNVNYTGDPLLLQMYVFGPGNVSLAGEVNITVKYLRIKKDGGCCSVPPKNNSTVKMNYLGHPVCSQYEFTVSNGATSQGTCEVVEDISLNWNTPFQQVFFDEFDFKIMFLTNMPVVEIRDNTICPSNSCVTTTQISAGLLEVRIHDVNQFLTKNNAKLSLVFSADEGCIDGFRVTKSEVNDIYETADCVPTLTPPYTLVGDPPRCISQIAGRVHYNFTSCDDVRITAVSSGTGNDICAHSTNVNDPQESYFGFCVCKGHYPYTVTCKPDNNNDPLCGVNAWDLVLISRQILNLQPLPNVLYPAADSDCNGFITTNDIVVLRKLILGTYDDFPDGVPSFKVFSDIVPASAWPDTEFCQPVDDLIVTSATTTANFEVVKTGDLDGSCLKGVCYTSNTDRDQPTVAVGLEKLSLKKGETALVPVVINEGMSVLGLQFELEYNPSVIKVVRLKQGDIQSFSEDNYHLKRRDGASLVGFVWHNAEGIDLEKNAVIVYLEIEVLEDIDGAVFRLINNVKGIEPLLFNNNGDKFSIVDRNVVSSAVATTTLEVTAIPNPFDTSLRLEIMSPDDKDGRILLLNQLGVTVVSFTQALKKGDNVISLDKYTGILPAGMYQLQIYSGDSVISQKIIRH